VNHRIHHPGKILPTRTIARDDVIEQKEGHMKAQTKTKSIRIMQIILVVFIVSFIYRANPNMDMLRDLPASENQIDDQ
jgi:hypothetical protein